MYCTINDLLTRIDEKVLINLSNDIFPASSVNTQRINETIEIADDIINSALRNKYQLPLSSTPKIITQIAADIVIYRLYSRRPQDIPKNYVKNFEDAIALLKDLQTGVKVLEAKSSEISETVLSPQMYMCDKTEEDRRFNKRFEL
ncbi:DUF1320 domain-containing protein [bacterium]|nr:DUF1320 domain-containing protein [bacterium]